MGQSSDLTLCYSIKLVFSLLANRIKDNILTFHFQVFVAFQKMFCFPWISKDLINLLIVFFISIKIKVLRVVGTKKRGNSAFRIKKKNYPNLIDQVDIYPSANVG